MNDQPGDRARATSVVLAIPAWRTMGVAVVAAAALLGALYIGDRTSRCGNHICPIERVRLDLEIDAMRGVDVPPLETPDGSFASVMAQGGIAVTARIDQPALPAPDNDTALDGADLYAYATEWRTHDSRRGVDAQMYALIVNRIQSDSAVELFGLMFDVDGRSAFAVAPDTTRTLFSRYQPGAVPTLQLRTLLHEFLHGLNREHLDAARFADGRLSIEAPTRCIAIRATGGWKLQEQPRLELSPATIRHFQSAPLASILPGPAHARYEGAPGGSGECERIRANRVPDEPDSWQQRMADSMQHLLQLLRDDASADPAGQRGASTSLRTAATARGGTHSTARLQHGTAARPAPILLQAARAPYPLGYPIALRVIVTNITAQTLAVRGRLQPEFGNVSIDVRPAGTAAWTPFEPLQRFEANDDPGTELRPGDRTEQSIDIFFGQRGWTFPRPGRYEVRARLGHGLQNGALTSSPITIDVAAPSDDGARAVLAAWVDARGNLRADVGRTLALGGKAAPAATVSALMAHARAHADNPLGNALGIALASGLVRPVVDPRTGRRTPPDRAAALALLGNSCTENGIDARATLLRAVLDGTRITPDALEHAAQAGWEAHDRGGDPVASHADPALRVATTVTGFAFSSAALPTGATRTLRRIRHALTTGESRRIVVVGHSDRLGSCALNDRLGLERARAVRRALVRIGVPREHITVATLGERTPLSFTDSRSARSSSRRVDILAE